MRVTRSEQNIEKAMRLHALLRKAEKLSRQIKPLRAHFEPLLDPVDNVLVAGRLAVMGTVKSRTAIDRVKLAERLANEYQDFLTETSYIEIDVKPAMQLAKKEKVQ